MVRRVWIAIIAIIVIGGILGGIKAFYISSDGDKPEPLTPGEEITEEESLEIARKFMLNSPTYTYDGRDLAHVETQALRCPSCYLFTFEFTSTHAGYGDRSKLMVAQVITPHIAVITTSQGRVTEAIMDNQWNMIKQEMTTGEETTDPETEIDYTVRFTGRLIEYHESSLLGAPVFWIVEIEEIMKGPDMCPQVKVITGQAIPAEWGTVDPDLQIGDSVEVYGIYGDDEFTGSYEDNQCIVTLASPLGSENPYYMKKQ
jgi:hypothetical protein